MGLMRTDRDLHEVGGGVLSAFGDGERASAYDRHARAYDRLIGNRLYNRVVWNASTASYASFAAAAVADGDGPLLDVGCGTALFTAASYRSTGRPVVLVDRSLGMLTRPAARLAETDPDRLAFVHAGLFDLPFRPGAFATMACHGLLHLFDDPGRVLRVLRGQAAQGGSVYATSPLGQTPLVRQVLRLLHRAGEAAPPCRANELSTVASAELRDDVQLRCKGAIAFLRSPRTSSGVSR
jgi:ubiquinone/menaquinone biosynthesis C-methylase UbiE